MVGRTLFVIAIPAALLLLTLTAEMQDRFPDGPGKAEVLKVCSGCHQPEQVYANPETVKEWDDTLAKMADLGAKATDEEWRLIAQYLDAKVALIKINAATVDEVRRTMEVSPGVASAVVKYRQEHGKFVSLDDLKKVPGLDAAAIDARKDRLIF